MLLQDISLDGIEPSWASAYNVALSWFPALDGNYDSRAVQSRGRRLLAALVLVAARADGSSMETVRRAVESEMADPGSVLDELFGDPLSEVRDVAAVCRSARGCWFGDALPFLALNVSDERCQSHSGRIVVE